MTERIAGDSAWFGPNAPGYEWAHTDDVPEREVFLGISVRLLWMGHNGAKAAITTMAPGAAWGNEDHHNPGPEEVSGQALRNEAAIQRLVALRSTGRALLEALERVAGDVDAGRVMDLDRFDTLIGPLRDDTTRTADAVVWDGRPLPSAPQSGPPPGYPAPATQCRPPAATKVQKTSSITMAAGRIPMSSHIFVERAMLSVMTCAVQPSASRLVSQRNMAVAQCHTPSESRLDWKSPRPN
jgi:hypothetical protein